MNNWRKYQISIKIINSFLFLIIFFLTFLRHHSRTTTHYNPSFLSFFFLDLPHFLVPSFFFSYFLHHEQIVDHRVTTIPTLPLHNHCSPSSHHCGPSLMQPLSGHLPRATTIKPWATVANPSSRNHHRHSLIWWIWFVT